MDAEKLLEALRGDSMARLRHMVLRRAGLCPFGLRARLISDERVLKEACFMLLEQEMRRDEGIPPYGWSRAAAAEEDGQAGRCGHRPLREASEMEEARRVVAPYGWSEAAAAEAENKGQSPSHGLRRDSPLYTRGPLNTGFNMERFLEMKEAADERI